MPATPAHASIRLPPPSCPARAPDFDRIARLYHLLEYLTLGRALSRTRNQHLSSLAACRRALILGDGDGRSLAALLRSNPRLHATAVDSSRTMLRLLTRRCAFAASQLVTRHTDAICFLTEMSGHHSFDLVATHFFLDCFSEEDLSRLIPAVRARLAPGALWVLSEFRIPPAGLLRLPARLLVRGLYLAFRLLTGLRPTRLPDFATLLRHAGLTPIRTQHRLGGLLLAELWQLPPVGHSSATGPPVN